MKSIIDIQTMKDIAVSKRQRWHQLMEEIARYTCPSEQDFWIVDKSGYNRHQNLFDNTAVKVVKLAAASITQKLMPKESTWASIDITSQAREALTGENKDTAIRAAENATQHLQTAINRSNFRYAGFFSAINMLAFGYCALLPTVEEDDTLYFRNVKNASFYIYGEGRKKSVFWNRQWSVREWNMLFPQHMIKGRQGSDEVMIWSYAIPMRQGWQYGGFVNGDNTFLYNWIQSESPLVIGSIPTDELYPINKAMGAEELPEVQTLNRMYERILQALSKKISPPIIANENALDMSTLSFSSNAIITANAKFGANNAPIMPLDISGDIAPMMNAVMENRQKVRESAGILPTSQQVPQGRTATEWLIQKEIANEVSNQWVDFVQQLVIVPALQRAVTLLQEQVGAIPPDLRIDGGVWELKVLGNEERQRRTDELIRVQSLNENTIQSPMRTVMVNEKKLIRRIADLTETTDLINTPEQQQQIIQAEEEEIKRMQQQQAPAQPAEQQQVA